MFFCAFHDDCHHHVRSARDLAGRQLGDQDLSRGHHPDVLHQVHLDVGRHQPDEVRCDRGWPKKNDPCDLPGLGAPGHPDVGRAHRQADDGLAARGVGCHLVAAESCGHRPARCGGQSMQAYPTVVGYLERYRVDVSLEPD